MNAADQRGGYISHGEIVEIRGAGLGPDQSTPGQLTQYGTLSTSVAGVQVFFSGVPAPLISVQAGRIVAIMPAVTLWSQAEVQVVYSGSGPRLSAGGKANRSPTTAAMATIAGHRGSTRSFCSTCTGTGMPPH